MSKTIDLQIEKSRILIDGLRKNMDALRSKGLHDRELDKMDAELDELKAASKECDAMREQLSSKVKHMNAILKGVKENFTEAKRVVKVNYLQEEWIRYGVQDKR